MTFYIVLSLSAFLISLLGTRLTIVALRKKVVPFDPASLRPNYQKPPPAGGGIAVVMGLIICLLVADINYAIILATFMLAAVSLLDDLIRVPLFIRVLVQTLAVLIALSVMNTPVFAGMLSPWMDKAVTAILWVWFINLFNLMDGIDGISATEMIGIGMGLCLITVMTDTFPNALSTYSLIIVAAGSGFLWWNWHPAKILLGEAGSIPIGFLLGYLLILAATSGYPYAAAILPAFHVADATITVLRRLYNGKKLFAAHTDHYYQKAVRSGRRHDSVARYVFGINFLLIFQATFSVIDPALAIFYVALAYASVFMMLGYFDHNAHDPDYEPFSKL